MYYTCRRVSDGNKQGAYSFLFPRVFVLRLNCPCQLLRFFIFIIYITSTGPTCVATRSLFSFLCCSSSMLIQILIFWSVSFWLFTPQLPNVKKINQKSCETHVSWSLSCCMFMVALFFCVSCFRLHLVSLFWIFNNTSDLYSLCFFTSCFLALSRLFCAILFTILIYISYLLLQQSI